MMGRVKTTDERISRSEAKRLARLENLAKAKELRAKFSKHIYAPDDSDILNEIRKVPGWTGEWKNDSKLKGVQDIVNRHYFRQKKG